jgi:hypothetical protein
MNIQDIYYNVLDVGFGLRNLSPNQDDILQENVSLERSVNL